MQFRAPKFGPKFGPILCAKTPQLTGKNQSEAGKYGKLSVFLIATVTNDIASAAIIAINSATENSKNCLISSSFGLKHIKQ